MPITKNIMNICHTFEDGASYLLKFFPEVDSALFEKMGISKAQYLLEIGSIFNSYADKNMTDCGMSHRSNYEEISLSPNACPDLDSPIYLGHISGGPLTEAEGFNNLTASVKKDLHNLIATLCMYPIPQEENQETNFLNDCKGILYPLAAVGAGTLAYFAYTKVLPAMKKALKEMITDQPDPLATETTPLHESVGLSV